MSSSRSSLGVGHPHQELDMAAASGMHTHLSTSPAPSYFGRVWPVLASHEVRAGVWTKRPLPSPVLPPGV